VFSVPSGAFRFGCARILIARDTIHKVVMSRFREELRSCKSIRDFHATLDRSLLCPEVLPDTASHCREALGRLFTQGAFGAEELRDLRRVLAEYRILADDSLARSALRRDHKGALSDALAVLKAIAIVCPKAPAGNQLAESIIVWLKGFSLQACSGRSFLTGASLVAVIRQVVTIWQAADALPCVSIEFRRLMHFELTQTPCFKCSPTILPNKEAVQPIVEAIEVITCLCNLEAEFVQPAISEMVRGVGRNGIAVVLYGSDIPGAGRSCKELRFGEMLQVQEPTLNVAALEKLCAVLFRDPPNLIKCDLIETLIEQVDLRRRISSNMNWLRHMVSFPDVWRCVLSSRLLCAATFERAAASSRLLGIPPQCLQALKISVEQLWGETIEIDRLRAILEHPEAFVAIARQVEDERLLEYATVPFSDVDLRRRIEIWTLRLEELGMRRTQLAWYAFEFCRRWGLEAANASAVHSRLAMQGELGVVGDFWTAGEVLDPENLEWLYNLRDSRTFEAVWNGVLEQHGASSQAVAGGLVQDDVDAVLKGTRTSWERLRQSVSSREARMADLLVLAKGGWESVRKELEFLECCHCEEHVHAFYLLEKLRAWAPAVLVLRRVLQSSFEEEVADVAIDACYDLLRSAERDTAGQRESPLSQAVRRLEPYLSLMGRHCEDVRDFVVLIASHPSSLQWIVEHRDTDDFNKKVTLARPNLTQPGMFTALASLQQLRTFLAGVLFPILPYPKLDVLLDGFGKLNIDRIVTDAVVTLQSHFGSLAELLDTHTASPEAQALQEVQEIMRHGLFEVRCSGRTEGRVMCRLPGDRDLSLERLAELHAQLLLSDIPDGLGGDANSSKLLSEFKSMQLLLTQCGECAAMVLQRGHIAYEEGQVILNARPREIEAIREANVQLQSAVVEWDATLDAYRGTNYYLNFFIVSELRLLESALVPATRAPLLDDAWQSAWPLLRIVTPEVDEAVVRRHVVEVRMSQLSTNVRGGSWRVRLDALSKMLYHVFSHVSPRVRTLMCDLPVVVSPSAPIAILSVANSAEAVNLLLSLFARRGRLPEVEELLVCTEDTTAEEVELLFRRFFFATDHQRASRLYCLWGIQALAYTVQSGAVEALRRLDDKFGRASASELIIISVREATSTQQPQALWSALEKYPQEDGAGYLSSEEDLKRVLKGTMERYFVRAEAVHAALSGGGKTHGILREVWKLQEANGGRALLRRVEVNEGSDRKDVIRSLQRGSPAELGVPLVFHLDLAHSAPLSTDALLMELLVVGVLRAPHVGGVYHCEPASTAFFVEVPNTHGEAFAARLAFCQLLPWRRLEMSRSVMDLEMPHLRATGDAAHDGALLVEFRLDSRTELVAKFLAAMRVEAFNPMSKGFDVEWVAAERPALAAPEAYDEILAVCAPHGEAAGPPSFAAIRNFTRLAGDYFESTERWNMLNLRLLQSFDPGLKHFRHAFCSVLVDCARAFALRQLPKSVQVLDGDSDCDIDMYASMMTWDKYTHPIPLFMRRDGIIVGCKLLTTAENQEAVIGKYINRSLQNSLELNDLRLRYDWASATHDNLIDLLHAANGDTALARRNNQADTHEYVFTVDNLVKMLCLHQRLRSGLPAVLMGETGCGKTALIAALARALGIPLRLLNIHGGITSDDIEVFVQGVIEEAVTLGAQEQVLMFFDEINASNCLATFKSLVMDRMLGNTCLPDNVLIVAACNPYRLRKSCELEEVALVFKHDPESAALGITDPMKRLVYRVRPLPVSLLDVVYDFGALSENSEQLYTGGILRHELRMARHANEEAMANYESFMALLQKLICASQRFTRESRGGDMSVTSMRDIARVAKVFKWFYVHYGFLCGTGPPPDASIDVGASQLHLEVGPTNHDVLGSLLLLTLGYCYYSRLTREERAQYLALISAECVSASCQASGFPLAASSADQIRGALEKCQRDLVGQMNLGTGIALNEALRENLFVLLVSILNKIPVVVVGKPGFSKSLALEILHNNLNGATSSVPFFRSMPAVEVFAYQCSPLSTPSAICSAFDSARKYAVIDQSGQRMIPCVLLDEAGLAEQSPHLPLKVLHAQLENVRGVACVAISNWALDASKMGRCTTLYRSPLSAEDLSNTAEAIVEAMFTGVRTALPTSTTNLIKAISQAYLKVYRGQRQRDFWGMRDFYGVVRALGASPSLDPETRLRAALRNFGGRTKVEVDSVVGQFCADIDVKSFAPHPSTLDLVWHNLGDSSARHLMLLAEGMTAESLAGLLIDSGLVNRERTEVMFGDAFPDDRSDAAVAVSLQRVKTIMQRPVALVMVRCDSLYESLYDLLNQHYFEYAGQRYVRIARGAASRQCPLHRDFRIIVVVDAQDSWRMAPPLLNRFEKQALHREDFIPLSSKKRYERILEHAERFVTSSTIGLERREAIAGYHPGLLSSLAHSLVSMQRAGQDDTQGETRKSCSFSDQELVARRLAFMLKARRGATVHGRPEPFREAVAGAAAEAALATAAPPEGMTDASTLSHPSDAPCGANKHIDQRPTDLITFVRELLACKGGQCHDDHDAQVMVMTHSSASVRLDALFDEMYDDDDDIAITVADLALHECSSSQDLESAIGSFYSNAASYGGRHFLLVRADPRATTQSMIQQCRFNCEKTRAEFDSTSASRLENVFVIIVVALPRSSDCDFAFDFDTRWQFIFLETLQCAVLDPGLQDALGMPVVDVVKSQWFGRVLEHCTRPALSQLVYNDGCAAMDLVQRVRLVRRCLKDAGFVKDVREWMVDKASDALSPLEDQSILGTGIESDGAIQTLSYHRTLRAIAALWGQLLAPMDRNGTLALLADSQIHRRLWFRLTHGEPRCECYEVQSDALTRSRPFASRFPASWYISRLLDSFRQLVQRVPEDLQLDHLFHLFGSSGVLENLLGSKLSFEDYLHDFVAIHFQIQNWVDRATQFKQMRALCVDVEITADLARSILRLHCFFWRSERWLSDRLDLLLAAEMSPHECLMEDDAGFLLGVCKRLTDMSSKTCDWEPCQVYRTWQDRWALVHRQAKHAVWSRTLGGSNASVEVLRADALPRARTISLFLRLLAEPLGLWPTHVQVFAERLPQGPVRTAGTLSALMKMVEVAWVEQDRQPRTDEAAAAGLLEFLEQWILNVALDDSTGSRDMQVDLTELLCCLAAGLPLSIDEGDQAGLTPRTEGPVGNAMLVRTGQTAGAHVEFLPRSSGFNMALLRKVMQKRDSCDSIRDALNKWLAISQTCEGRKDSRLAVMCSQVLEEEVGMEWDTEARAWSALSTDDLDCDTVNSFEFLTGVSRRRAELYRYASLVCEGSSSVEEASQQVNIWLAAGGCPHIVRAQRLFVMRCIERRCGTTALRNMLVRPPLCKAAWLIDWRASLDVDDDYFRHFLQAGERLPTWSPFSHVESTVGPDYYLRSFHALQVLRGTLSVDALQVFAAEVRQLPAVERQRAIGALLSAVCCEAGSAVAAQVDYRPPPWCLALHEWLADSEALPASAKERQLLRIFAGDAIPLLHLEDTDLEALLPFAALRPFNANHGSSEDNLLHHFLLRRVLGHLAAALIAADADTPLSHFRLLMLDPDKLKDTFLPAMDGDAFFQLFQIMRLSGDAMVGGTWAWYTCPCGMPYPVGECGRPMETARCPSCKGPIGGERHTLVVSNKPASEQHFRGYTMLPAAQRKRGNLSSVRGLDAPSAQVLRLLLHGAMVCGLLARTPRAVSCWKPSSCSAGSARFSKEKHSLPRVYGSITCDIFCSMGKDQRESRFLGDHLHQEWNSLGESIGCATEDVAVLLHHLVHNLAQAPKEEALLENWQLFSTPEERAAWERLIQRKYLWGLRDDTDTLLNTIKAKWGDDVGGAFMSDLKSADGDGVEDPTSLPRLWGYRLPVTLDTLRFQMACYSRHEDVPLLKMALLDSDGGSMESVILGLSRLEGVFKWRSLMEARLGHQLTFEEARRLTVRDLFDRISASAPGELPAWERAFEDLRAAWSLVPARWECLDVPAAYRERLVDLDAPLTFCIADARDECICLLSLTHRLAYRHNEVCRAAGSVGPELMSWRQFAQHDQVEFSSGRLLDAARSCCTPTGRGGRVAFDLLRLERYLRRGFCRPRVDLAELRRADDFPWCEACGPEQLAALPLPIAQVALPAIALERLRLELSNGDLSAARTCSRLTESAMSAILSMGGSATPSLLLSKHLRLHPSMARPAQELPSQVAREVVQLCHLDALLRALKEITREKPMDGLGARYRQSLPESLGAELRLAMEQMDVPHVLRVFASLAEQKLKSDSALSESVAIAEVVQIWDTSDMRGFSDHFPKGLLLAHFESTYKELLRSSFAYSRRRLAWEPAQE